MWNRIPIISLVVLLAGTGVAGAQETAARSTELVEEVASLRKSVEELVSLLDIALDRQRIELLLKRIEVKERRLEPLGDELRKARNDLRENGEILERLNGMLEAAETRVEEEVRAGIDRRESDSRLEEQQLRNEIKFFEDQTTVLERRVRELEDDLAERRKAIEVLEDMLEEEWDARMR